MGRGGVGEGRWGRLFAPGLAPTVHRPCKPTYDYRFVVDVTLSAYNSASSQRSPYLVLPSVDPDPPPYPPSLPDTDDVCNDVCDRVEYPRAAEGVVVDGRGSCEKESDKKVLVHTVSGTHYDGDKESPESLPVL